MVSDSPLQLYEAEGPLWTDSDGEERCGWPYDGWHVSLRRVGADAYELLEESNHIDADGGRGSTQRVDCNQACRWLAGRVAKDRAAFRALEHHFAPQLAAAQLVARAQGRALRRLHELLILETGGSFRLMERDEARATLAELGADPALADA